MARRLMRARPSDEPADGAAGRLTAGDWRALRRILPAQDADGGGVQLLERLRLRIAEARAKGGREAFEAVLRRLTDTEAFVSARLMREIGAVDAAADAGRRRPAGRGSVLIPEWRGFLPEGRMDAESLCRHVLIIGQTGSGKTASGILPAVRALLNRDKRGQLCARDRPQGGAASRRARPRRWLRLARQARQDGRFPASRVRGPDARVAGVQGGLRRRQVHRGGAQDPAAVGVPVSRQPRPGRGPIRPRPSTTARPARSGRASATRRCPTAASGARRSSCRTRPDGSARRDQAARRPPGRPSRSGGRPPLRARAASPTAARNWARAR